MGSSPFDLSEELSDAVTEVLKTLLPSMNRPVRISWTDRAPRVMVGYLNSVKVKIEVPSLTGGANSWTAWATCGIERLENGNLYHRSIPITLESSGTVTVQPVLSQKSAAKIKKGKTR